MIEEPTCLILGAGASVPYGLPTTAQLRDLLLPNRTATGEATAARFPIAGPSRDWNRPHNQPISLQNEWALYLNDIAQSAGLLDLIPEFRNTFFGASGGIDWFLRYQGEQFSEIARLQLAAVLLNCERVGKLYDDWYEELVRIVMPTDLSSLAVRKLSIITFNYDRSFERFFLNTLYGRFGLQGDKAKEVLNRIRIEHVYGQLGALDDIPYGEVSKANDAAHHVNMIRPEVDRTKQERLRPLITESRYINFIGFGFDEDNVKLLGPKNFRGRRVYSTSVGLGRVKKKKAALDLGVQFGNQSLNAAQLFAEKDLFGPKIDFEPEHERYPAGPPEDIDWDTF